MLKFGMDKNLVYTLWLFFIIHAVLYVVTNFFFFVINLVGDFRKVWFFIPLLLWGVVLYGHYSLTRFLVSGRYAQIKQRVEALIEKYSQ